MTRLKYFFKTDTLFKLLFTKHPDLLKSLVSALVGIKYEDIEEFQITNPEISPEELGKKFCRLDINMMVNGQKVDLEVQVSNEGNYPERSLYYWAREFSTGLDEGKDYSILPRTIIISILGFNLFPDPKKFYSEFQALEVTSHEPLTDKMALLFFELKKLPPLNTSDSNRDLWLKLFKAETEEELSKIEKLGVSDVSKAIGAYRHVAASPEFREIERMRSKARHDEAQALRNARIKEREKWQVVVANKDAEIADKDAELADKDAELADKGAEIARLLALIEKDNL